MELTEDQHKLMQDLSEQSMARVAELIGDWLQPARGGILEDWGCGSEVWAKQYVTRMQYVGVDVRPGPNVDVVQNLVYRRSNAEAILIHHVLGLLGDYWEIVIANAFESFRQRMLIVEDPASINPARLLQVLQSFARPFTIEILPDGRRAYLIER